MPYGVSASEVDREDPVVTVAPTGSGGSSGEVVTPLEILYQDDDLVAVNKPANILVHRTGISTDRRFVLQMLRDQLGRLVYPVHRLDRATSGVLLFGLNPEAAAKICRQFAEDRVEKRYLAVVRGYLDREGQIDYPLDDPDTGRLQESRTCFRTLGRVEVCQEIPPHPTARYSLVEVIPKTGRRHQIRRHFKHVFHPVIGDVRYGDGRHNRLFRERFGVHRLLLHAWSLQVEHPESARLVKFQAPVPGDFFHLFRVLGWELGPEGEIPR